MRRVGAAIVVLLAVASCSEPSDPDVDTLDSLVGATGQVEGADDAVRSSAAVDSAGPSDDLAGTGFVSIQVRLAKSGVDETLSLDRASVPADELAPISLFASCTGIDGGDDFVVAVTDLRRLASGEQLVAVRLAAVAEVDGPGEHEVTLDVSDAAQITTSYTGTMVVEGDERSGKFRVVDEEGNAATGSFLCADHSPSSTAVPTVTSPPLQNVTPTLQPSVPPTSLSLPTAPSLSAAPSSDVSVPPEVTLPITAPLDVTATAP